MLGQGRPGVVNELSDNLYIHVSTCAFEDLFLSNLYKFKYHKQCNMYIKYPMFAPEVFSPISTACLRCVLYWNTTQIPPTAVVSSRLHGDRIQGLLKHITIVRSEVVGSLSCLSQGREEYLGFFSLQVM